MELTVQRLTLQGDGVVRGTDGPVYVPMALPSEVVTGEISDGRVAAPKILTPSADRVRPPCPHYRSCGGCQLQHGSDAFVAGWKQTAVRQALHAQGIETEIRGIDTSPLHSRRRAVFSGRRTKKGVLLGFHARGSDTVVEVTGCLILRPELLAVMPALREATQLGNSRKGEMSFTVTLSEAGPDVSCKGGKEADADLIQALVKLATRADLAGLSYNGAEIAQRRPATQRFGAARVTPPSGAFLQATAEGEAALLTLVREAVSGAGRITDLFAGSGTFALPLASDAEVHAVEGETAMIAALDAAWRGTPGLKRLSSEVRDLFRRPLLPDELARFDAVVIDPPRAGAAAQVAELAKSRVPVIAHVSCNPVTFARDARALIAAGYRLDWVQVVDQFRWSVHVELMARFSRI
jgi:23S rRNA (uracil1939-C5)-methyltransferase